MKKLALAIAAGTVVLTGCQSTPTATTSQEELVTSECVFRDAPQAKAPLWVCDVPIEGFAMTAVGFSEKRPTQMMTSSAAEADARVKLAQFFATSVAQKLEEYQKQTINDAEQSFALDTEIVRESFTNATLFGARVVRSITSPSSGFYVVLAMDDTTYNANAEKLFAALVDDNANIRKLFEDKKARERLMSIIKDKG